MTASFTRRVSLVLMSALAGVFALAAAAQGEATIRATDWRAAEIDGAAVAGEIAVELRIEADGAASGRGGCNRFTTRASIEGDTITFAPAAATRMACPQDVMRVEAAFFAALEAARRLSFDPDAGELYLHDAAGSTLVRFVGK